MKFKSFKCQSHKMVKQTVKDTQTPTNCLSVFDHFVGLALKGLKTNITGFQKNSFEAYSQSCQTSRMKLFEKIVNG